MELKKEDRVKLRPCGGLHAALGKFFLCRTSTVSIKQTNQASSSIVDVMVSDPEGIGKISLTLKNYCLGGGGCLEDVLPVGSYLAIKDPHPAGSNNSKLVCDNPGEVVLLSKKDVKKLVGQDFVWTPSLGFWDKPLASKKLKKATTVEESLPEKKDEDDGRWFKALKNLGNKLFISSSDCYVHAVRYYDLALQYATSAEERSVTLSNKSKALLMLGCYGAALEAAKAANDLDPTNVKPLYRMGEALKGLGHYEEAAQELKSRMGNLSKTEDAHQKMIKGSLEMIENHLSRTSSVPLTFQQYDSVLDTMVNKVDQAAKRTGVIDFGPLKEVTDAFAEFPGEGQSVVQVKETLTEGIMGRGLFASRDIAPGEVVLMSRALAFKTRSPGYNNAMAGGVSSPHFASLKADLVSQVANKVSLDPGVGTQIYQLYAGKKIEPQEDTGLVDVKRIKGIVNHNATTYWHPGPAYLMDGNLGLWFLPSFINHSCSGRNVMFEHFGEFLLVKALEKIKEGEEILRAYVPEHWPYEKKQDILNKAYGFTCTCPLCTFALREKDSPKGRRWVKIAAFWMILPNPNFLQVLSSRNPEEILADMAFMEGLWKDEAPYPGLFRSNGLQNLVTFFMMAARYEDAYKVSQFALLSGARHGTERVDAIKRVVACLVRLGRKGEPLMTSLIKKLKEELILWYGNFLAIAKEDPGFLDMLMNNEIPFFLV